VPEVTHVGALVAGLLSFFSPCVLPLVPPYLCFLGGVALNEITGEESLAPVQQRRVVVMAAAFVAGFTTVFVAFGATASALGRLISDNLEILSDVAGAVIIVMGLHFLGVLKIPVFYRETRFHPAARPLGLIGAFVIGLAFAFGWTPCIGPVLATVLMVAGATESVAHGAGLLAVYSAGIGIPFLIAALAARPFIAAIQRYRNGVVIAERTTGVLLVLTGVAFIAGAMPEIATWLLQTFPAFGRIG
jgi:cytochrome c-type biogenesis protein